MPTNFYMFFVSALIPLLVGAVYYHPSVFGSAWMKVNKFKEEDLKGANMALIFGLSYLFGIFISMTLSGMVVHQSAFLQAMMPAVAESGSEAQQQYNSLMAQYGGSFRSLGHGALHGAFAAIFFALPLLGINALFERRGWKYILIHTGYWLICFILMGMLLAKTLVYGQAM